MKPETNSQKRSESKKPTTLGVGVLLASALLLNACTSSSTDSEKQSKPPTTAEMTTTSTTEPTQPSWEIGTETNTRALYSPSMQTTMRAFGVDIVTQPSTIREDYVESKNQGQIERYLPFAEVTLDAETGALSITDTTDKAVDTEALKWFGERFDSVRDLAVVALESGGIDKITLAFDDDSAYNDYEAARSAETGGLFGYYNPDEKAVVLEISTMADLFENQFVEQYLTHELLHPLLGDSKLSFFSAEQPDPDEQRLAAEACSTLRDVALMDMRDSTIAISNLMNRLAELEADPALKERLQNASSTFGNGEWIKYATGETDVTASEKLAQCIVPSPFMVARIYAETLGLPGPGENREYNELAGEIQDNIMTQYGKLLKNSSIYSILSESSYLPSYSAMGHPFDGWDEGAAGSLNVMINFPQELGANVAKLDDEHRSAVLNFYRVNIDALRSAHPELSSYIATQESEFMSALNQ